MNAKHFLAVISILFFFVSCAQNSPIEKIEDLSEPETEPAVTFTVTVLQTTGGTVTLTPQKESYTDGESVTITAVPEIAYRFTGWNGTGAGNSNSFDIIVKGDMSYSASFIKRKWTFVLYMASDNDLEGSAIQDINELEAASMHDAPIDIVALVDRGPGYDSTNGDWQDTRLYRISPDINGLNVVIVSERIDCPRLGITATGLIELNMADPDVLDFLMSSAKEKYPAENYALIIWGHGTGWRNSSEIKTSGNGPMKAMAVDDTSVSFMTISEVAGSIAGKDFTVIGFDTCFGALLEIAYEMRFPAAQWLIGSESATPATGWNYTKLFDGFTQSDLSITALSEAAVGQFSKQYEGTPKTTISVIDLTKISKLRDDFEIFSRTVADSILTTESRAIVRNLMLTTCDLYNANTYPCDTYIDIYSMTEKITNSRNSITADFLQQSKILSTSTALVSSIAETIALCWSQGESEKKRIGVNLIPFIASDIPQSTHDSAYIRGSEASGKSAFVRTSTGWVPNMVNAGSLLDKIFYSIF